MKNSPENRFRFYPEDNHTSHLEDRHIKDAENELAQSQGNVDPHVTHSYLEAHTGREGISPSRLGEIARRGGTMPDFATTEKEGKDIRVINQEEEIDKNE